MRLPGLVIDRSVHGPEGFPDDLDIPQVRPAPVTLSGGKGGITISPIIAAD